VPCVLLTKLTEQRVKQRTTAGGINILIPLLKELPKQSTLLSVMDLRDNVSLQHLLLLHKPVVDEYGFIVLNIDELKDYKHPKRALWKKVSRGVGSGNYRCKGLCRLMPKRNSRHVSFKKTGEYFCVSCEIAMRCCRCHCCGRAGRVEPRGRHYRLDGKNVKYVE
jgi:hypothetical protein